MSTRRRARRTTSIDGRTKARLAIVVVVSVARASIATVCAMTEVGISDDGWRSSSMASSAIGLASRSDAESCRRETWRVNAVEACGIVASRAETRCEFAVRATTCRLRRAGGRARVEVCVGLGLDVDVDDDDDGGGGGDGTSCERCALRAFRVERDDARTFLLDGSMEFAIFIDETRAVESECAHVVALRRAEMAAASIETLSARVAEADRDARRRAETISETLRDVDETARRNARAAAEASRALDDVRRRQLEITTQLDGFFTRFESFIAVVGDALARIERSTRLAAAAAARCARLLADAFASVTAFETAILRACVIFLGLTRARCRRFAVVTLCVEWISRTFVSAPALRLRVGLACAGAPTLARVSRLVLSSARDARSPTRETNAARDAREDARATDAPETSSRGVAAPPPASRANATGNPDALATRPSTRRRSERLRRQKPS